VISRQPCAIPIDKNSHEEPEKALKNSDLNFLPTKSFLLLPRAHNDSEPIPGVILNPRCTNVPHAGREGRAHQKAV
jgi:hypothetical protein